MDDVDDIVREFLVESHENLDQLDRDLVALEERPGDRPLLSSVFRTIHTIKGTSGFLAFGGLERLTHVGESLLVELRDGRRSMDQPTTDVLLAVVDRVRDLLSAIEADGTEGAVVVDDVVAAVEALRAAPAPLVAVPAVLPAPHPAPEAAAVPVAARAVTEEVATAPVAAAPVPAPADPAPVTPAPAPVTPDRKSTRLNSSH